MSPYNKPLLPPKCPPFFTEILYYTLVSSKILYKPSIIGLEDYTLQKQERVWNKFQ